MFSTKQMLSANDLSKIESLGDNCELGFFLRKMQNEESGFFRWTLQSLDSVCAILENNFENLFEFENLVPHAEGMVWDKKWAIGFHSKMLSSRREEGFVFELNDADRFSIYSQEKEKVIHLAEKFRDRCKEHDLVFVAKSFQPISINILERTFSAIQNLAGNGNFTLLAVEHANDSIVSGTVFSLRPGVLKGYIKDLAPYEQSDKVEIEQWTSTLQAAFANQVHRDFK
jgi:hypothetical protein